MTVEPAFDPVEQIGEHGGRRARPDQPLGFEDLHVRFAEAFGIGIEQSAEGATKAVGAQRLLERAGLQQH